MAEGIALTVMPRRERAVAEGVAHHVTQRGVNGQIVFFTAADREVYLSLVEDNLKEARVTALAWCLMSNHVHWVVVPERADSLAILFRRVHGRYAQYLNARRRRSGHLWQNRFFSCALSRGHVWRALRYVELNPLRASLAKDPAAYAWSSAAGHLAGPQNYVGPALDWGLWEGAGRAAGWRELLTGSVTLEEVVEMRKCTYAGKPLGDPDFLAEMEARFGRKWLEPGRPRKTGEPEKGPEHSLSVSAT